MIMNNRYKKSNLNNSYHNKDKKKIAQLLYL